MGVMAAASLAGSALSAKDKAKQAGLAEDQQRKQKAELVKSMNIENQDLTLQDKQNLQDAFAQKSDNNLKSIAAEGLVRTAIGESGLKGHSMERIQRDVEAQRIRANAGVQENYERDYSKLYIQREQNKVNTNAQIRGMAPVQMPNRTAEAVGGVLSAVNTAASTYSGMKSGGMSGGITSGLNSLNRQENP